MENLYFMPFGIHVHEVTSTLNNIYYIPGHTTLLKWLMDSRLESKLLTFELIGAIMLANPRREKKLL